MAIREGTKLTTAVIPEGLKKEMIKYVIKENDKRLRGGDQFGKYSLSTFICEAVKEKLDKGEK